MPKPILKDVLTLASKSLWQDVISATDNVSDLVKQPRLFGLRLEASIALADEEKLRSTCADAAATSMPPQIRYATLRPLMKVGRGSDAWQILMGDSSIVSDPGFLPQAHRVAKGAKADRGLKTKITSTLRNLHPRTVRPHRSKLQFANNKSSSGRPLGSVTCLASTATDQKHLVALNQSYNDLLHRIAQPRPPRVREFHDVFVDRYGQIWAEDGAIVRSYGKPMPSLKRSDCQVVDYAVNGLMATRGIYHWLIDRMPHFGIVSPGDTTGVKIIMWEGGPRFERESLDMAGFEHDQIVTISEFAFIKRLVVPDVGFAGLRHWAVSGEMFERMSERAFAIAEREGFRGSKRIYVSRRDSVRRPLDNELELEALLEQRGFSNLLFAEMPMWQKIVVCSTATHVIGPHGAGLAHLIYSKPGTKVLEVLPIMDGSYALRFIYSRLSTVLGLDYQAWLEPQLPQTDRWRVDLAEFTPVLDRWLAE
ncbi:glycosyltransferase family 61 protein [Rhizobium sp. CFBP 13726]|jgi:hypothetical protein|uniref:glycosyltransferase family 61 protein n=1 Tax=unclassified Rhizobium TaxID=2613769 RepID=UPI000A84A46B|nr:MULTISPECIES: glycosyltransferase family 61 protein [unclassified Rhizobium]MBD8649670.1 glycosyltransferase family 61 protein [Rhizobium sp. CFBP 13726]